MSRVGFNEIPPPDPNHDGGQYDDDHHHSNYNHDDRSSSHHFNGNFSQDEKGCLLHKSTLDYFITDFFDEHSDPISQHFPLMGGGPWKIIAIVAFYLLLCLVILPRYMKNRPAFECRSAMIYYNLFNVIANLIGFVSAFIGTNYSLDVWGCKEKYFPSYLLLLGYGYFILKLIDFFDTIFFVLRKKYNQVTFLHVTHHSIMPITCYVGMKFVPYGNTGFTPLINSFVHVVMYFYYYLACLGPEYKKYLWWKNWITGRSFCLLCRRP